MGWTYPFGATKKSLIAERTEGWSRDTEKGKRESRCLRHCYRGNNFSGVLWSVWEQTQTVDGEVVKTTRWIQCDVMKCYRGEWGYKDMEESMHPYYYSCPLSYLQEVPINQYGGNAEWRRGVIAHNNQVQQKRRERRRARQNA